MSLIFKNISKIAGGIKLRSIPNAVQELFFTICGNFSPYYGVQQSRIAQLESDGIPDLTLKTGAGFQANVYSIAVQTDGKILVGGAFTSYNGTTQNYIARLNPDGSRDTTFAIGSGFNGNVHTIVIQTDGKILVGGEFTSYNGTTQNRIARLNPDGSRDTSFSIGTGFNYFVYSIVVQPDGKILVGGEFTSYNGTTQNYIARLNPDGSRDTTISNGFNGGVRSITVLPDGKILVGGEFTSYNGTTQNRIARLNPDGSRDTSFAIGSGFNSSVRSINVLPDGKILVGGGFTSYNGTTQNFITRLNPNGSRDTTFAIGTGFNSAVFSIVVQPDGKILVGGGFTSYNGTAQNFITRLNPDGSRDTSFSIGTGFNSHVYSIVVRGDNKILVGGLFTAYYEPQSNRIVRMDKLTTRVSTSFNTGAGFNSFVYSAAMQSDGKILVGGEFTSYNGTTQNRITRLNTDGSIDTTFAIGTGFNSIVRSITVQSDGKILVGGDFTSYNGTTQYHITRLNPDGSRDTSFSIGSGFDGSARVITVQSNGKILVGGQFYLYNGTTQNRIARLNPDGSIDTSFSIGTGFNSHVFSIVVQPDGKILVGGGFSLYNGTTQNRIARLNPNGSRDTTFAIGTGFNNTPQVIVVQADGKILVGGDFTSYNGTTQYHITRLNPDGSRDTSFSIGTGFNSIVYSIVVQSDGKILVGGEFGIYNGTTQRNITRLNPNGLLDNDFRLGHGFNGGVYTIVAHG